MKGDKKTRAGCCGSSSSTASAKPGRLEGPDRDLLAAYAAVSTP